MEEQASSWRRCSNCKKPIALGTKYWMCSVSSCSKVRAPVQFCSPNCWAVHDEVAFHKSAWAVEHTAPKTAEPAPSAETPTSKPVSAASTSHTEGGPGGVSNSEVLVVVSRLKELIKRESNGMSTSDQCIQPLSDHVRKLANQGIENAKRDGRKTLLDRDIPFVGPRTNLDVVVVVSKLKDYVRAQADLRTSDDVPAAITTELRRIALFAIERARKEGRKTVMGRDIPDV